MILLLALFATFTLANTLNAEKQDESIKQEETNKQEDEDGDMKSLMQELMKGVVAQVHEEEDQKSSAELENSLDGLLSQAQDDDDDGDALVQEGDDGNDNLLALLQDDVEGSDGAQEQEDDDNEEDLLALLQGDAEEQDDDDGGDAVSQGWLTTIGMIGRKVVRVCRKVNRYSRLLKCIPGAQAEMQKADDGDEDLARDMLKRIAKLQEEGGDSDAEAQFFRKIFRRARRFVRRHWRRPRKFIRRIRRRFRKTVRRGFGRAIRFYRMFKRCARRFG